MTTSATAVNDYDDPLVMRRLLIEPLTPPFNNGYRKSFARALATCLYLYGKSRRCTETSYFASTGEVLCYGFFPNELHAIDAAVRLNPTWRSVPLNLRHLRGLDWRDVFAPTPRLLPRFLRAAWKSGGWPAVRDFVYPFVGYLLLRYFVELFARLPARPAVVTTNLVHPASVGIHLAALRCGLRTIFWEHAMTPRMIARDMGYSEYNVYCSHTVNNFVTGGVRVERVRQVGSAADPVPVPLGDPRALIRVGVCVNDLDASVSVAQVLVMLRNLGRQAQLRVHDSDQRYPQFVRLAAQQGTAVSNAAQSRITQFMDGVDVIIAGNSNVVLDCLRAGMRVIYFWQGDPALFDYYGIVAATRCESATSVTALAAKLGYSEFSEVR